jgi:hypothetical protein
MTILVTRNRASYDYKRYKNKAGDWANNDNNNSLDIFQLFDNDRLIFEASCQTVANMEGIHTECLFNHTLKPGNFAVKLFVDRRRFYCDIHGIIRAFDFNGEYINEDSVTPSCANRMLVHDWQSLKPKASGKDTRVAWSDGCIVMKDRDLDLFNKIVLANGLHKNDIISAELVEEAI